MSITEITDLNAMTINTIAPILLEVKIEKNNIKLVNKLANNDNTGITILYYWVMKKKFFLKNKKAPFFFIIWYNAVNGFKN